MSGTTKRWLLDTAERTARTPVQGPGRGDAGRASIDPDPTWAENTGSGCSPAHTPCWPLRVPSRSARTTRPRCCPNTWTRRSRDPPGGRPQGGPTGGQRLRPSPSSCHGVPPDPLGRPGGLGSDTTAEGGEPSSRPSTRGRTSSPWTATSACACCPTRNAWVPPARIGTATRGARRAGKVEPRGMAEGSTRPGSGRHAAARGARGEVVLAVRHRAEVAERPAAREWHRSWAHTQAGERCPNAAPVGDPGGNRRDASAVDEGVPRADTSRP